MDSEITPVAALRAQPYFKALDEAELKRLARTLIERAFDKDETVFLEGEPCQGHHRAQSFDKETVAR